MRALSIRQPWAWAICYAGKRVENRIWQSGSSNLGTARKLVGQTILIHAAKGCTRGEYDDAEEFMNQIGALRFENLGDAFWPPLSDMPRGKIVATAKLVDVVETTGRRHRVKLSGLGRDRCLLCSGDILAPIPPTCPNEDQWAMSNSTGLILADVVPLARPVPFKGALGFFEVPGSILEAV